MLYIALALSIILCIFFAVAHEEVKFQAGQQLKLVRSENKVLREIVAEYRAEMKKLKTETEMVEFDMNRH